MMDEFVEAQTRINKEVNEAFMQINTEVESLNKVIETQISLLAQASLGSFTKSHVDVITTNESQIKNLKESDNVINEKSNEKRVEIAKVQPTPPKEEVVKEVEKEASYILPPPYNPPTPFTQRLVEAKVESQSKRDVEELKNINTNAPLYEIPYKKRNLEDNREIISVKKGRVDFEVPNEEIKPSPEKLIIKIDPEPPPHDQISELPYKKKKIKSEGAPTHISPNVAAGGGASIVPPAHTTHFSNTFAGSSSSSRQSSIDDVLHEIRAQNALNQERDGLFYAMHQQQEEMMERMTFMQAQQDQILQNQHEMQGYYHRWESSEEHRQQQLDNVIQELGGLRLQFNNFQNYQHPPS
ncbi:unnamed protein product [Trifolium pratense]|uniref:Uncharacterized protein n=1 Tax=Trifolium pratense TaxID=57577 RepID=A0ACB0JBG4_TRIPR|nr:unnamed protein product [Trifolium pratense]